jgi:hypothetical protein
MSTSLKQSSSFSQPQSSSSGSSDLRFNLGGRKWLRLLLGVLGLYLVFLPIWWYTLGLLASFAGTLSNLIYHFFDPQIAISSEASNIKVIATAAVGTGFDGQSISSALRLDRCTYGLPMIAALVLVTPAESWSARLRSLALGVGTMILLTVPAVLFWAKMTSLQLTDQIAGINTSSNAFYYYAFHGYAFSQPVVAVLIWSGLILLGSFNSRQPSAPPPAIERAVSRNEPCPCGSGRKYKKCCGVSLKKRH